ncbi:MAG TPA: M56 family metallopeptidase [Thermoanaerobaculia bacterium]|jgi:beta-lactamase regulating signal transducer with metallopeptidase domain|nr:M56 family metallopeptidase [Thermoanaerobaculia bacterium]
MLADLFPDQTIAWLLTYLLHSTLLLGLACLVAKPLGRWSAAAEETVWKLALVGAFCTASLQLAAGFEPAAGRWNLPGGSTPAAMATAPDPAMPAQDGAPVRLEVPRQEAFAETPVSGTRSLLPSATTAALGAWGLGACLLLVAYGRSHLFLRRRLKNRPRVVGGTLFSRLRSLSLEAGFAGEVRLSCSSRMPVPVALGLSRSEICVPPRALAGLSDEQQEGMLAHELAHLVRRDPLWLVVSYLVTCAFFFQPLNWVARRRLREISEMLSDEWAVGHTGRPLSLAGCLAEVAGWSTAGRELPVPVMADRPSHLARRIRRLLDESRSPESPARRIWLGAAMVVLLIAVVAAAPAISASRPEEPDAAEVTDTQETAAAPAAASASEGIQSSEPADPQEHDVAEERVVTKHVIEKDGDDDGDWDPDPDFDVDVDFAFDADEIAERTAASVEAALEAVDGQLEALAEANAFSQVDQEKLEQDIERANEEIERNLRPRMEQLSRELSERLSRELPTPEMRRLEQEMEKLAEQMRPSEEEMAKMHARLDEELRKLKLDGELNREERQRIAEEARRMAREIRPTEEQRKAMAELRRQHHELSRQFREEHREEIDKATREMREEIQREMSAVREELRRTMEQRQQIMQDERRERQRQREIRREKERQREESEDSEAKPPRVSRRVILAEPAGAAIVADSGALLVSDSGVVLVADPPGNPVGH